ncbi:MAG: HAD-IA family hydrolase [Spirochaetaceae bacterium]|jgi:putative hydrolase of the HAD superfamily|nr:HAD-IA family hydrolase [Spirochaetaceae bacterium]
MIKYLLFDLDNTLYSSHHGLEEKVGHRMREYAAAYLGTSPEEAWRLRLERTRAYGTTLEWLMAEKGFTDVEGYLAAVHPEDEAENLPPDPELGAFLESIPLPKAILTNSPREHADRILARLALGDIFTHIFDIRETAFKGKPGREVFERALSVLGVKAGETLFIDDTPRYVTGFTALGGRGLLMDEDNVCADYPGQRIRTLRELANYLG